MRLFLIGAVVMIVFAIIGTAAANLQCLGVDWTTWLCASLLSVFVDWLFGAPAWANGGFTRAKSVE